MSLSRRRVEPEILDDLTESDPRAVASRRDLRRVNALMIHRGILVNLLRRHLQAPPRRILEIGAGDGSFMLAVARRLAPKWPGVHLVLLDRQQLVSDRTLEAFRRFGWRAELVAADVFDWTEGAAHERFDAVTANLFLHHFREPELARLLRALSDLAPVVIATEPARAGFPLLASKLLWAIGANEVTRNDAPASVRAGFAGTEISALWPQDRGWHLEEGRRGIFTQAFSARRVAP
jgi:2-polyprenyl-3-methyl-5-hydroxy-6-metoxy-1,4-benzoquinol methylase